MTIAPLGREATVEDLYAVEGRAELVDGRLILVSPSGDAHNRAARNIAVRLTLHEWENGGGRACVDGMAGGGEPRTTADEPPHP